MSTTNHTSEPHIHANAEASEDPTGTTTLRGDEASHYNAKWEDVAGVLRDTIEHNDALRLRDTNHGPTHGVRPGGWDGRVVQDFGAEDDAKRLARFTPWYRAVLDRYVLKPMGEEQIATGNHYSAQAIRKAYARGLSLANSDLRKSSSLSDPDTGEDGDENPTDLISQDPYQEQLGKLFDETYNDVQHATNVTHTQTHRRLSEALGIFAAGALTVREVADRLIDRVRKVGKNRTRLTANSRVVEGVNKAILTRGSQAGVQEVGTAVEVTVTGPHEDLPDGVDPADVEPDDGVKEEWETAGDNRVCPRCDSLEGSVFRIIDILAGRTPQIPKHPVCRCRWILAG